jgi:hypothetical protein
MHYHSTTNGLHTTRQHLPHESSDNMHRNRNYYNALPCTSTINVLGSLNSVGINLPIYYDYSAAKKTLS